MSRAGGTSAHSPVAAGGQSHGQPPLLDVVVPGSEPKSEPIAEQLCANGSAVDGLSPSELSAEIVADTGANKLVIGASHSSCI